MSQTPTTMRQRERTREGMIDHLIELICDGLTLDDAIRESKADLELRIARTPSLQDHLVASWNMAVHTVKQLAEAESF